MSGEVSLTRGEREALSGFVAGGRLTDSQFDCLWALWLGSKGSDSNARTLESLRRRGLAAVRDHQGGRLWEATRAGDAVIASDPRSQP